MCNVNSACNGRAFYMKTGYLLITVDTKYTNVRNRIAIFRTKTGYSLSFQYPIDTNYSLVHDQQ